MQLRECNQPYFELQTIYNGSFRPCCYFGNEAPIQHGKMEEIWNSPYFQEIRAIIAGGEGRGTGCDGCSYIKYEEKPSFAAPPSWLSGYRLGNWLAAEKHHAQGDLIVSSLPVKYYLQFGLACNLRCAMCDHPERFKEGENSTLDANLFAQFKEYLAHAESAHIIGGEPFLIPSAVSFIKEFAKTPELWATRLNLYTNSAFLDRFIELLEPVERVSITASLDSFGEHYESIRLRGKWSRVSANLQAFRSKGESLRRWGHDWSVHIACILQKSGVAGLPDLARWCVENQFSIHFGNVVGNHLIDENIFEYPTLLSDIPGWEDKFQEAIETLENGMQPGAASRLKTARNELKAALDRAETKGAGSPIPQKIFLDTQRRTRNRQKRILDTLDQNAAVDKPWVIYGAGAYGKTLLRAVTGRPSQTALRGFVDSAPEKCGKRVSEYDVHSPSFLRFPNDTQIVVAIGSVEAQYEVEAALKTLGASEEQILLW